MGLFDKFKKVFAKKEENKEDVETYEKGLEKTRKEFVNELSILGHKYTKVSDEYFDELESILIMADIGVNTVMEFIDRLKARVKKENITDTKYLQEVIVDELFIIYVSGESLSDKINMNPNGPTVILMVGVNGAGKTTSIGKIANNLIKQGKKVIIASGDTFRAAATEQLEVWANRAGAELVKGPEGIDPASVIFDSIKVAKEKNADVLICDTAGRLQNKKYLMDELEKIKRVIDRELPNSSKEVLLVLDASTGQNAISQVKAFEETTGVTGLVLTKLDGTAKGGVVIGIVDENKIPIKYIGIGEQIDDMEVFNSKEFIDAII